MSAEGSWGRERKLRTKQSNSESTPWTNVPFLKNERYKDDLPFTPLQFSLGKTQAGFLFLLEFLKF
jgi:hypothetical protein